MGYLNGKTDLQYYSNKGEYGNYQFVSLEDIINQFLVVYVGDEKTINKASRVDVAFWAQRALAELSFDTFRSVKAQQIKVPPSLSMILPKDYVNYTKLSWVDTAGVKHPIYPTSDTSNPYEISQNTDGSYLFDSNSEIAYNFDFLNGADGWTSSGGIVFPTANGGLNSSVKITSGNSGKVNFLQGAYSQYGKGTCLYAYQEIDASELSSVSFSGEATTEAAASVTVSDAQVLAGPNGQLGAGLYNTPGTTVRIGFSSTPPSEEITMYDYTFNGVTYSTPTPNSDIEFFDIGYIEWTQGESGSKEYDGQAVDLSGYSGTVYFVVLSIAKFVEGDAGNGSIYLKHTSTVDNISITSLNTKTSLTEVNPGLSSTFSSYNASALSENNNDDYEDDIYWPNEGERYGLDPQRSQVNGTFYIDDRQGKINFSSNISGKTVILDYISDSLGTDGEMQVHKFAEEAIYKWITYGILSTKVNIPEYIVQRTKKEKFAATRQAKLRLSNIKLHEITQILRGKSKQIKH